MFQFGTIGGVFLAVATFLIFYRPVLLAGDTHYLIVRTGSMEPAVPVGSVVVIKPADFTKLQKDEIICFKGSEPQLITHRIFDITDEGFITKGDANKVPDSSVVEKKDIIGKVVFTIPYLGYLNYFVNTPLGFTLLIILPTTLIITDELREIINHRKDKNTSSTRREN